MPERVGRYDIVLQIARGGMATVYLARAEGHGGFDRYVALKLTAEHLRDDPEFAEHLVEEAKLVAHLRHQNVVPVLDVGEHDMAVFLVMDYVPGDTLGGLFKLARNHGEQVAPRIGLRILIDALAGLHAAHEHRDEEGKPLKLVHRDFSPQNILVGTDGIARLTDFGIAKAVSRASVTMAGTMKGKVSYASPEQARGKDLDRRCDVWAAGVIAWEIFAGRKLFPANERTLLEVVKGPPPRIRSVVPSVPPEIDEIIAQALGFEVEQRTPTAKQLARSLEDAARRHGLLAEVEEVAEYVQRVVAPTLADRKKATDEARVRRGAGPSPSSPETNATVPLPALPEMPTATRMMESAPALPPAAAPRPSYEDALIAPPGPPAGFPSAGRLSTSSTTPAGTEAPYPTLPMNPSPIADLAAKAKELFAKKPAVAIGAAAGVVGLLLLVIIVVAVSGRSTSAKALAAASASASASAAAPPAARTPAITATAATATKPTAPPPSLGEPEPLAPQLELTANAPVRTVSVGSRVVEIEVPAPTIAIELTPEEAGAAVTVSATSTDGRGAKGSWNPGDPAIQLAFGDAPAPHRPHGKPKPGKPGGKPKHL